MESRNHSPVYRPAPDFYARSRCNYRAEGGCVHLTVHHGVGNHPEARDQCWWCDCSETFPDEVAPVVVVGYQVRPGKTRKVK